MQRDGQIGAAEVGRTLVDAPQLRARVRELGQEIARDYAGSSSLLLVGVLKDLDTPISGRDVLIVEDIVNSGLTLKYLLRNLGSREPASLGVCALLAKPACRRSELSIRYVGFEIPDTFAVGYGLDHSERYRNLPYIAAIAED